MNVLCFFGFHRWKFYSKRVKLKEPNIIRRNSMSVPLRECKGCNKLEHHLAPTMNGSALFWKDGEKFRNVKEFLIKEND